MLGPCRKETNSLRDSRKPAGFAGSLRRRAFFGRIPPERPPNSIGIGLAFETLRRTPSLDLGKEKTNVRRRFAEPGFVAVGPLRRRFAPNPGRVRGGFAPNPREVRRVPSPKGFAEAARKRGHPQERFAEVSFAGFQEWLWLRIHGVKAKVPRCFKKLRFGKKQGRSPPLKRRNLKAGNYELGH